MSSHANKWREEFDRRIESGNYEYREKDYGTLKSGSDTLLDEEWFPESAYELDPDKIKDFIQTLLDQHSAHLVERISELKVKHFIDEDGKEYCNLPHEYCDTCEHNQALDQAIDIVKNNK